MFGTIKKGNKLYSAVLVGILALSVTSLVVTPVLASSGPGNGGDFRVRADLDEQGQLFGDQDARFRAELRADEDDARFRVDVRGDDDDERFRAELRADEDDAFRFNMHDLGQFFGNNQTMMEAHNLFNGLFNNDVRLRADVRGDEDFRLRLRADDDDDDELRLRARLRDDDERFRAELRLDEALLNGLNIPADFLNFFALLPVQAQPFHVFTAHLTGANEVPPVVTGTTGDLVIHVNPSMTMAEANFKLSVFNGMDITQAHLHCGAVGTNGPIVATLFGDIPGGFDVNGTLAKFTLTDANMSGVTCGGTPITSLSALVTAMNNGLIYANVHSVSYPAGLIRGQVMSVSQ